MNRTVTAICVFLLLSCWLVPAPVQAAEIPEVQEDQALIVFYREKKAGGAAIRFHILRGNEPIGSLNNGTVLFHHVDPGTHVFTSEVITGDALSITVEAGKVYFVRGTIKMGLYAGRPTFNIADEQKARNAVGKL